MTFPRKTSKKMAHKHPGRIK
ncbi:hypothetical protein VCRA2113O416_30307 [Vibrio crassostreae]|nr:hypothetical protein VCHA35O143_330050 [Vibrio chagasii]CAK2084855.1 hypothetical protein VCRA2113O416_30307 [Vibrio crassostreae]CAK2916675.1 hypothetical protein VCRA2127O15_20135 [Vibrio crassostreae]CAK2958787.1 hypothetical protein VCRA2133O453_30307 [Vibrio crassostreae]CAK2960860.1 hypothetical protein VCRA2126O448_30307 [Vibrio crassostreae]